MISLNPTEIRSDCEKLSFSKIELGGKEVGVIGDFKLDQNGLGWKSKGGQKVIVVSSDLSKASWIRSGPSYQLRIVARNGNSHKFDGFKNTDYNQLSKFFSDKYKLSLEVELMSSKGWNWGEALVNGQVFDFKVDSELAFELPLAEVTSATVNKQDVVLGFNQDDADAYEADSLVEMRLYVPTATKESEKDIKDFDQQVTPAEKLTQSILNQIIPSTTKPLLALPSLPLLTPKGHYDLEMFPSFFRMHGKTDHRIKYSHIVRLFKLPKPDNKSVFFVISLEPGIRQGHTTYPYLVFHFYTTDNIEVEVNLPQKDSIPSNSDYSRFEALGQVQSGPLCEVVARTFQVLTNRKISIPKNTGFKSVASSSTSSAIKCSLKTNLGYLFPLEHSFMFVHKPPTHIRFEDVSSVDFISIGFNSFDFQINLQYSTSIVFSNIQKIELNNLVSFCKTKELKILNFIPENEPKPLYSMKVTEIEDEDDGNIVIRKYKPKSDDSSNNINNDNNNSSSSNSESGEDYNLASRRPSRRAAVEAMQKTKSELISKLGDDDDSSDVEFDQDEDEEENEENEEENESDDDDVEDSEEMSKSSNDNSSLSRKRTSENEDDSPKKKILKN